LHAPLQNRELRHTLWDRLQPNITWSPEVDSNCGSLPRAAPDAHVRPRATRRLKFQKGRMSL